MNAALDDAIRLHPNTESESYDEILDASKLASGIYIYRLQAGNFTASRKFVLMK